MTSSVTTMSYITINWETPFDPVYGEVITIPPWTVMWRGYDVQYPDISERTMYYSSKEIASGYVHDSTTHKLGCFMTTRPLRILDLRFMKQILSRMIQRYRSIPEHLQDFAQLMLSFGLCSLKHQIILVKNRYAGVLQQPDATENVIYKGIQEMEKLLERNTLLEQTGIRVAETTNDGGTMALLKELLSGHFDGFFSPRLQSAFHIEKNGTMSPELILFNPKRTGILQISPHLSDKTFRLVQSNTFIHLSGKVEKSFIDFISQKSKYIPFEIMGKPSPFYMSGKGYVTTGPHPHPLDVYYMKMDQGDKETIEHYTRYQTAGRNMRGMLDICTPEAPVPCVKVSPFPQTLSHDPLRKTPSTKTRKKGGFKKEKIINIYPPFYESG
jgi:hypothetical protein